MTRNTHFLGSGYNTCVMLPCKKTEHTLFLRREVQEGDSRGRTELLAADQR